MSATNTLDRLDADPGGCRRYIASLIVVGGATHAQIAKALSEKFPVNEPTTRIVGHWRNHDAKLIALVDELEAVKRDVSPGDDLDDVLAAIPAPADPAAAASDLMGVCVQFPAFAKLIKAGTAEDVRAVLTEGHETDADFEAACEARVADFDPHAEVTPVTPAAAPEADPYTGGGFYA